MCAGTLTMTTQTQTQTIQNGARVLRLRIQGNLQNQQQSLLPLRLRQREHSEVDTNNSSDNERAKIRRIEAQQQQEHQEEHISYTPEQIRAIRLQRMGHVNNIEHNSEVDTNNSSDTQCTKRRRLEEEQQQQEQTSQDERVTYTSEQINAIRLQRLENLLGNTNQSENNDEQIFRFDDEFGDDFDDNDYFNNYNDPNDTHHILSHINPRFIRDIARQLVEATSRTASRPEGDDSSNILTRRMVNDVIELLLNQSLEISSAQIRAIRRSRNSNREARTRLNDESSAQIRAINVPVSQNMPEALTRLNDDQLFALLGAILHENNYIHNPKVLEEEKERKFAEPTDVVPPNL